MKKKDKIENSLKIYPVPKEDAERGKKPLQKLKPYLVLQYLLKETDKMKTLTPSVRGFSSCWVPAFT